MADDGYLTIHRTTDVAQGELLAELLRREGIDARFKSVSSTLIGVPASMIEMTVDVPAESAARARELIADLEYTGAAEALERGEGLVVEDGGEAADDDAGEAEDGVDDAAGATAGARPGASRAPSPSRRRPLFAAGFAVFLPGGGHLYARRAWTALVLAAAMVVCLTVVVITRSALTFEFAFAILIATVACDAVGGVRAARAEIRGQHRGRGAQIARGLGLLGVAIVVGGGVRFATGAPRLVQTWKLSRYGVSCADNSIVIENRSDETREIEIANLKIGAFSLLGREAYDVGIKGARTMTLPPGGRGAVTPDVADWLARSCGFPSAPAAPAPGLAFLKELEVPQMPAPRSMHCGFAFSLVASEKAGNDAEALGAVGSCVPPTTPGTSAAGKLAPLH